MVSSARRHRSGDDKKTVAWKRCMYQRVYEYKDTGYSKHGVKCGRFQADRFWLVGRRSGRALTCYARSKFSYFKGKSVVNTQSVSLGIYSNTFEEVSDGSFWPKSHADANSLFDLPISASSRMQLQLPNSNQLKQHKRPHNYQHRANPSCFPQWHPNPTKLQLPTATALHSSTYPQSSGTPSTNSFLRATSYLSTRICEANLRASCGFADKRTARASTCTTAVVLCTLLATSAWQGYP